MYLNRILDGLNKICYGYPNTLDEKLYLKFGDVSNRQTKAKKLIDKINARIEKLKHPTPQQLDAMVEEAFSNPERMRRLAEAMTNPIRHDLNYAEIARRLVQVTPYVWRAE